MLEPCERDVGYPDGNFDCILNGCLFVILFSALVPELGNMKIQFPIYETVSHF